jgi:hypothetical protein
MKGSLSIRGKILCALPLLLAASNLAFAGASPVARPTPTLDEFGLLGVGALIGVVGIVTLLRRKK